MATYKYQQNLYDGAAEGYVKYNITPAPGTYVAPGESVTISGQAYWRDGTIYGVLMDLFLGDPWEDPDNYRHATVCQKAVKISKGKTGTFSMSFTLTEEDALVLGEFAGRAFDAQLVFTLADDSTLSSGSETRAVAAQKVSILKNRVSPVIDQAIISDVTDAAAVFGDFVQGQSRLKMTMRATTDPLDSAVTIASRVLTLGAVEHTLSSDEEEVGAVDRSGAVGWTLKVTDSKGLSAETSGTISLLPYQPPVISALSAQRYREVVADDGTVSYIADEEGEHVRFSLTGAVTSVSGKNAWTLSVGWNGRQSEVRSGTDGAEIVLINDRDAVPDGVSAAERVEFAWTLQDHFTSVTLRTTVDKSGAYFNVETDGVAVGMRTTGKPDKKKFEVAEGYESHFYGGIAGVTNYVRGESLTGGTWIDGKPIYRMVLTNNKQIPAGKTTYLNLGLPADSIDTVIRYEGYGGSDKVITNSLMMPATASSDGAKYINATSVCLQNQSGVGVGPEIRVTRGTGLGTVPVGLALFILEYTKK